MTNDKVYALDATTGSKQWSFATGDTVTSSPAVADGVVYVGSGDDHVRSLDATTGTRLWRATTGGPVVSVPAVANGVVYASSQDGNLYSYDLAGGQATVTRPAISRLHPDHALRPDRGPAVAR